MPLISHNPTTGQDVASFDALSLQQIDDKIGVAQKAFEHWKDVPFVERAQKMLRLAELLKGKSNELAKLSTIEMGKPLVQAKAEIEKCAWACEYYAKNASNILAEEHISTEMKESYVRFDPLGIILAVMPWNFPYWQVFRFVAPALMAGNVGLLKHASNVPQCALAIENIILDAGFPHGVFQTLLVGSESVEYVLNHEQVTAVTLTGSEHAGSLVAAQAGKLIKKIVLELGGSDPFIVLEDADIPHTCEIATIARLQNAGQSCIAAKRFIVMESKYDEFVTNYKQQFERFIVGDPSLENTQLGPVVSQQSLRQIHSQVTQSIEKGAILITGGKQLPVPGYFYAPTILAHVTKGMPVYDEEVFGPVSAVIKASSIDEAINIANDTPYGLGATLWTKDYALAKKIIPRINAGSVFVNSMVKSDPRLPFGGVKKSGYGRELSTYGIKEFVNIKTVVLQ